MASHWSRAKNPGFWLVEINNEILSKGVSLWHLIPKLSAPAPWIPAQCPRPVVLTDLWGGPFRNSNSSSVPPPRGFQLSAPAPWSPAQWPRTVDSISVPPPCAIPVECPRGMCWLIMTSLVEFPRPMVFSQSDPARCMPRGGGTHLECHVAGELSTGRGHWTHVAGALFAYLYHRVNCFRYISPRYSLQSPG